MKSVFEKKKILFLLEEKLPRHSQIKEEAAVEVRKNLATESIFLDHYNWAMGIIFVGLISASPKGKIT